jgi:hypothetical protein
MKERVVVSLERVIGKKIFLVQSHACISQKSLNVDTTLRNNALEDVS